MWAGTHQWRAAKVEAAARVARPGRLDRVDSLGVDEHVWRPGKFGAGRDVTVMVDLTRGPDGILRARLLDMAPGRRRGRRQVGPCGPGTRTPYQARPRPRRPCWPMSIGTSAGPLPVFTKTSFILLHSSKKSHSSEATDRTTGLKELPAVAASTDARLALGVLARRRIRRQHIVGKADTGRRASLAVRNHRWSCRH